jgi:hypothetical protein
VVLAILFYVAASKARELSFYVNPTTTTIVRSGQSSDLHVLYKGQPVSTDVTAFQLEVWNAGKEAIRTEHLLEPIVIETSPRVAILEARIRHVNRLVTQAALDVSQIQNGRIRVSWKILERNDGVVIQLIVAGPASTSVLVSGSVEGQKGLKIFTPPERKRTVKALMVVYGVNLAIYVAIMFLPLPLRRSRAARITRRAVIMGFGILVLMIAYFILYGGPSLPVGFD